MACLILRCPTNCQPALDFLCIPTGNAVITERRNTLTIDNSATKCYQTKTPDPFYFSLVGESMETSSEKSASIVVRTYLFLADGAFDGKGFAG